MGTSRPSELHQACNVLSILLSIPVPIFFPSIFRSNLPKSLSMHIYSCSYCSFLICLTLTRFWPNTAFAWHLGIGWCRSKSNLLFRMDKMTFESPRVYLCKYQVSGVTMKLPVSPLAIVNNLQVGGDMLDYDQILQKRGCCEKSLSLFSIHLFDITETFGIVFMPKMFLTSVWLFFFKTENSVFINLSNPNWPSGAAECFCWGVHKI